MKVVKETRKGKTAQAKERTPDEVRESLLEFLYHHHQSARGVQAQEMGIRKLQQAAKARYGFSQQQVAANLDYLVQKGWVRRVERKREFTTPRGTVRPREQVTYKISDAGIDEVEGESRFKRLSPYGGINIANVQGAVVVGDRNVVHNEFIPLSQELDTLRQAITASGLSETDKVAAVAEIQTIQSQLAKETPNQSIIQQAWTTIERLVTASEFAALLAKVGRSVSQLFS